MIRISACLLGALALVGATTATANAQAGYFGQNKVQYRNFKFQVLKTQHFDIYFYPEEEGAAHMAARMAERWYTRLSSLMDHELRGRQAVILYGSGSQFRQTNVVEGDLGEGTGGVTEAYKRRIVLPFAGPIESTDHVLGHELVHAFQYDMTNTSATAAGAGAPGAMSLPLWFIEGMAEYLSLGPLDPNTAMWMRESVRREKMPTIDQLDNPKYFSYRYGQALWAFIGGKYGDRVIPKLLMAGIGHDGYKGAFQRVLGVSSKELSQEWQDATAAAFRPVAETTKIASSFARPLITNPENKGGYNTSPELSPDGSKIAFFSSRDLFSIDLYIADAQTGKIIRKVTNTATDAHLDSIEFIDSAGSWSRDGKRFAFPGLSAGNPILTIVNADNGDKEAEIPFKTLDEIMTPTWSPDGRRIAFTGMVGGYDDLFIYDLDAKSLHRVTSDAFAELQPAWSPDGKTIAFSTDRFGTNIERLSPGNLRLAFLDVASGQIRQAGGFDNAKNINPEWGDDGSLYFVSDRLGISNVYRLPADSEAPAEVTNLLTGASGITDLSPALSVAGSRLVFSVYEADGFNIYALDTPQLMAGGALWQGVDRNAGLLPPRKTGEGIVYAYLHNDAAGLPVNANYPTTPYKPKLSLDFLGQPVVGVGVDSFGTYVGGGISAMFSDTLGNHILAGDAQVTNRFDEAGGTLVYLNRTHRWNWGASIDQTPYVVRGFNETLVADAAGNPLIEEDEFRQIQTDRGLSGVVVYPFSRAERVELSTGLRQITGKTDVTTRLFDYVSGQQLTQDTTRLDTFPTLNLGIASTAFVHDTSIFGATSPIRGSRFRLEYDQTYDLGGSPSSPTLTGGTTDSLTYGATLGDFRTYLMPVRPFTIALRGLYYARHGAGAESNLLTPVFIGYPDLVRGYDYGSFTSAECGTATNGSCAAFDRLIGSRMLVANAELRFPPWGAFGGSNFYGPLPVELGLFMDGGAAWDSGTSIHLSGPSQNFVKSWGAVARVNVLGFAVAEIDYVRPLDRLGRGWMWEFNLRPGF
jgi:Tol biopolymer transport system component